MSNTNNFYNDLTIQKKAKSGDKEMIVEFSLKTIGEQMTASFISMHHNNYGVAKDTLKMALDQLEELRQAEEVRVSTKGATDLVGGGHYYTNFAKVVEDKEDANERKDTPSATPEEPEGEEGGKGSQPA